MANPCEQEDSLTAALAAANEELGALMQTGLDALSAINDKVGEMQSSLNEELANAATEINDFQTKLNEALTKSGQEFAEAMNELNSEFGEAMAEAGEDINEILNEIGVALDEIPTPEEILNMGLNELSKLAPPNVDSASLCSKVPKIELTPDGKAVKGADQPLLPKIGPLVANLKSPKTSAESNPSRRAVFFFTGGSKTVFNEIKKEYIVEKKVKGKGNFYTVRKELPIKNKLKLKAETYYYYKQLASILGVEISEVYNAAKAIKVTAEQASDAEVSQSNMFDRVKKRYEFDKSLFGLTLSFEEVVVAWQKQYTEPPSSEEA